MKHNQMSYMDEAVGCLWDAFVHANPPKKVIENPPGFQDTAQTYEVFQNRKWDEIEWERLSEHPTSFMFLTLEALAYYLPGLLLSIVEYPEGDQECLVLGALDEEGCLAPSRLTFLTREQKQAVRNMLDAIRREYLSKGLCLLDIEPALATWNKCLQASDEEYLQ